MANSPLTTNKLPQTSPERLNSTTTSDTILYLAYGSNLSVETFRGRRGIKPLSACNVQVPSLTLTFDLAGIPYTEPCFANTAYRIPPSISTSTPPAPYLPSSSTGWSEGLIGVVYEVTPADYHTIIQTEGGGASYQDVLVDCYVLPLNPSATSNPMIIRAHTLLAPQTSSRIARPASYPQASARYLKLITSGAEEHSLPAAYLAYLYSLQPYTITTYRQTVGKILFGATWMPIILAVFGLGKLFADEEGKLPGWLIGFMTIVWKVCWGSYDVVFKPVFGDGERTIEKGSGDEERGWGSCGRRSETGWCEKSVRLE